MSRAQRVNRRIEWHHFRVHRELAQAARDQLRVLRAEIEHENDLMGHSRLVEAGGWFVVSAH
jgi:hypothetical protein